MKRALSDFDDMRMNRLPNWGRWGRHDPDKPDANRCGHSICVAYIPKSGDWDWEVAPEPDVSKSINFPDAENLDGFIMQLARDHRQTICRFFYKRQPVSSDRLYEAVRMLLDLTDANRQTVDKMYALLYG